MARRMLVSTIVIFICALAFGGASPSQRIIGGIETTIDKYPFAVAVLKCRNTTWMHFCGGTIINNRSFLSAASCFWGLSASQIRARVGSSLAHIGGSVYEAAQLIIHPFYSTLSQDYDIAIVRVTEAFSYGPDVSPARIAGSNYFIADNISVWVIGWGEVVFEGKPSEQLRHVEVWTVNQATCRERYSSKLITDNMLCAGYLDVGGRDACTGDTGGPLLHNNVVIGVTSWGQSCGSPIHPSVYTRVPRFTVWIQQNA